MVETTTPKKSRLKKGGIAALVLAGCMWAVGHFESSGKQHLIPYRDIGGVWTVCDGHTGSDVKPGVAWTEAQCEAQKKHDIDEAGAAVASCVVVPLTDGQQVAFIDFAYNVGGGTFCRSSMARLANAGRPVAETCAPILRYVYIGKLDCRDPRNKCAGIVRRRQWQYDQCMNAEVRNVQVAG